MDINSRISNVMMRNSQIVAEERRTIMQRSQTGSMRQSGASIRGQSLGTGAGMEAEYRSGFQQKLRSDIMRRSGMDFVVVQDRPENRRNMGQDLELVTFLMSLEIERLHDEVEVWQTRYNDLDRRISDRESLEIEINNMTNMLNQEKNRASSLQYENEELKNKLKGFQKYESDNQLLQNRVQNLRVQIEKLEQQNNSNLGQISILQNENKEQKKQLENRVYLLQNENDKLIKKQGEDEQRLMGLQRELNRMEDMQRTRNMEYDENKNKMIVLNSQITEYRQQQGDYERRLGLLTQEMEKLQNVNYTKSGEMDRLKGQLQSYEVQMGQLKSQGRRLEEYENKIALLTQEIERLNHQCQSYLSDIDEMKVLIGDLNDERQNHEKVRKAYENEKYLVMSESRNLKAELQDRQQEVASLNGRISQMEYRMSELNKQSQNNQDLENRVALLSQEIERLNNALKGKYEEIENMKSRNQRMQQDIMKIRDYEDRVQLLSTEIERLNGMMKSRQDELEGWKSKYSRSELAWNQSRQEMENKIVMLTTEIERLKNGQSGYQSQIDRMKQEIEGLEMQLVRYRASEDKLKMLSQEIDRLNGIIEVNEGELSSWRQKYVEYGGLQNKIQEHLGMFVILFAEIESLRARMLQKDKEVETVRRSSLAPFRS